MNGCRYLPHADLKSAESEVSPQENVNDNHGSAALPLAIYATAVILFSTAPYLVIYDTISWPHGAACERQSVPQTLLHSGLQLRLPCKRDIRGTLLLAVPVELR